MHIICLLHTHFFANGYFTSVHNLYIYNLLPAIPSITIAQNCFDFFMVPKDRENKWAALNKKKKREMNLMH